MKYKIKEVLSDGYVMGEALKLVSKSSDSKYVSKDFELVKLNHSIQRTSHEINEMKHNNPDLAEYLETERLIAVDPILKKGVVAKIELGYSAELAVDSGLGIICCSADNMLCGTDRFINRHSVL